MPVPACTTTCRPFSIAASTSSAIRRWPGRSSAPPSAAVTGRVSRGGRRCAVTSVRLTTTRAIAASSSAPSNSGQFFSVKYTGAPVDCHSRKLETRPSPLVRTSTSTGGSSGRYSSLRDRVRGDRPSGGADAPRRRRRSSTRDAVVERDREQHPGVLAGVGDRLADRPLDQLRGARALGVERPADPLDPHVQLVELLDPGEQLAVQAEDVAHLGAGTDPVLGGEAEHGEPADVALDSDPDDAGDVLLALGVARRARLAPPLRPAPVAVHDAADVERAAVRGRPARAIGITRTSVRS